MLQLYLVYRLLLFRRHWSWTVVLAAVFTIAQWFFSPEGSALERYRYNFMGGMLPFALGILYARGEMPVLRLRQRFNPFIFDLATFLLSTLLIILLSGDFMGWSLVPAFVCTAGVSLVRGSATARRR